MVTAYGYEKIQTLDYIDADHDTQLYNFVLDGDHTYYADWYLVHNKQHVFERNALGNCPSNAPSTAWWWCCPITQPIYVGDWTCRSACQA